MNAFISKPFNLQDFRHALEQFVRHVSDEKEL